MKEIKQNIAILRTTWESIHKQYVTSPELWEPYLQYSNPEIINEIIDIIAEWLERDRAKPGFAPVYKLAKGLLSTNISSTIATLKQIEEGKHSLLPTLIVRLNQILNALHTVISQSVKDNKESILADISIEFSENLSLLETAQKELERKVENLKTATEIAEQIGKYNSELDTTKSELKTKIDDIESSKNAAIEKKKEIGTIYENSNSYLEKIEKLLLDNEKLNVDLKQKSERLNKIIENCENQQETIVGLLPTASSAGLAHSFSKRVKDLNKTKIGWIFGFLVSIIGLGLVVLTLLFIPDTLPISDTWWISFLQKIVYTSPFIWLGWFSAVQYGNTIRVQEDYAFKEATSKAFSGFRDHMDYLANIELEEGNHAMRNLAVETIKILSREPLRIFQKSSTDATPAKSIMDILRNRKSTSKVETS